MEKDRRVDALGLDVAVALAERDAAVRLRELRAGEALAVLMDREGLSVSEVVERCAVEGLTTREVARLRRVADA